MKEIDNTDNVFEKITNDITLIFDSNKLLTFYLSYQNQSHQMESLYNTKITFFDIF
jgi:hypothetical protein